jgi:HEAT repeat protein
MTDSPAEARQIALKPCGQGLQDAREHVRLAALAELLMADLEAQPPLETVVPCLDDASNDVRRLAVELLLRFGPQAVPALSDALDAMQPLSVRIAAASALARLGPNAEPAIEALCRNLQTDESVLRWHASFALSKIGPSAVPRLRLVLSASDPQVVTAAVDSLAWIGPGAKEAQEDLQQLGLSATSPDLQLACATALVKITEDASRAKPVLVEAFETGDVNARKNCVQRIGGLGSMGKDYQDYLLRAGEDQSPEVRAAAALALAKVLEDPSGAVPALTKLLSDPDLEVRVNAAMGLARYGPAASSALPLLLELQQQSEEHPAAVARAAIEKIEGNEP